MPERLLDYDAPPDALLVSHVGRVNVQDDVVKPRGWRSQIVEPVIRHLPLLGQIAQEPVEAAVAFRLVEVALHVVEVLGE